MSWTEFREAPSGRWGWSTCLRGEAGGAGSRDCFEDLKSSPSAYVESIQEMEMGCPEKLCSLHLCRFSRPGWVKAMSSLI